MSIATSLRALFKNHYEKIILVFLLIAFAILLFVQIQIVQVAQNKKVDDKIGRKELPSDYKPIDFASGDAYKPDRIFSTELELKFRDDAEAAKSERTNVMVPFRLAECISCHNLIPEQVFPPKGAEKPGACPVCGAVIQPRATDEVAVVKVEDPDLNKNGIPDVWEQQHGLKTPEEIAADGDIDKDGFTLAQEFKANTDPRDPKSHPAYITETVIREVKDIPVAGLTLINLVVSGNDRNRWRADFRTRSRKRRGRASSELVFIGKTFEHNGEIYTLLDIANDKAIIQRRGSKDTIECFRDRRIMDSAKLAVFYNKALKKTYTVRTGGKLTLGDKDVGEEVYPVVWNAQNQRIELSGAEGGSLILLPTETAPEGDAKEEAGAKDGTDAKTKKVSDDPFAK